MGEREIQELSGKGGSYRDERRNHVKGGSDGLNEILNRNAEFRAFHGYVEAGIDSSRRFDGILVLFSGFGE
jgi:hypothetical protein